MDLISNKTKVRASTHVSMHWHWRHAQELALKRFYKLWLPRKQTHSRDHLPTCGTSSCRRGRPSCPRSSRTRLDWEIQKPGMFQYATLRCNVGNWWHLNINNKQFPAYFERKQQMLQKLAVAAVGKQCVQRAFLCCDPVPIKPLKVLKS